MKRSKPTSTQPTFARCTDCGKYEVLRVYVTGAPLCDPCGYAEVEASKAKRYRLNESADLAGEPLPYPELAHAHEWDSNEYCSICGADGRA